MNPGVGIRERTVLGASRGLKAMLEAVLEAVLYSSKQRDVNERYGVRNWKNAVN